MSRTRHTEAEIIAVPSSPVEPDTSMRMDQGLAPEQHATARSLQRQMNFRNGSFVFFVTFEAINNLELPPAGSRPERLVPNTPGPSFLATIMMQSPGQHSTFL